MSAQWTQKQLEKVLQHYQDETGILTFQPTLIAEWAKERGYEMPVPPTDVELLSRMLSGAASTMRRKDRKTAITYRPMLVVKGIWKGVRRKLWFDADGPAATFEKVMESYRARKDHALNILVSAASNVEHWLAEHPTAEVQGELDFGISDQEVRWRMLGPDSQNQGEEKAS